MNNVNYAKNIVKMEFKIAVMDAMQFNPFKVSEPQYLKLERELGDGIEKKLEKMNSSDIIQFANAIVRGSAVRYDQTKDDFFVML